jgi:putative FmdB family regulatory protein
MDPFSLKGLRPQPVSPLVYDESAAADTPKRAPLYPLGREAAMPLYEYECSTCRHRFEMLVFASTVPACPKCGSGSLQKLPSAFAVAGRAEARAESAPVGGCGTCGDPRGPGSCANDN